MSSLDIREAVCTIDKIIFADEQENMAVFHGAYLDKNKVEGFIAICDETDQPVYIAHKDVPNLIKALKKAIELGWDK